MNPLQKKILLSQFPELASALSNESVLENIFSRIQIMKGEKGDSPTNEELITLIKPLIPVVKDGHTPTDEELLALIKPLIPVVKDGKDGKNARNPLTVGKVPPNNPEIGDLWYKN